jgi:hypothetical protein
MHSPNTEISLNDFQQFKSAIPISSTESSVHEHLIVDGFNIEFLILLKKMQHHGRDCRFFPECFA